MRLFLKLLVSLCVVTELFQTLSAAVQTSILGKTTITSPVLNRSVFTIVRFLNIPCSSPNGMLTGICYSLNDCIRMQGTQIGTCASGFGVCCTFQRTCGATTNQNSTHFTNPGYPNPVSDSSDTMCTITLLRSHKVPICQVRLDFLDFALANPTEGDCLDDKLVIQGNNINAPVPSICGRNTGQHNVDNSLAPVTLSVSTMGLGRRTWNIRTSYIECGNPSRAPPNCLQYFTGTQGRFSSFNYVQEESSISSGGYLNNLNYAICFRKEVGRCTQTYTADSIDSFVILNLNPSNSPTVGSGEAGLGVEECPDDYLRLEGDRYCGARLNPSTAESNPTISEPVTDTSAGPFIARFRSNSENNAVGFDLRYSQNPCS
ncbi:CUB domain-containing protein [Caerostris darwini]|uniref:CUB domain-containing protein n=1 Tax=Caerostris darwini TaxID=1538125 RepID=A0AAV4SQE9_9ARAC|nr:CUB domain-containing protein [Caerostris darwini]